MIEFAANFLTGCIVGMTGYWVGYRAGRWKGRDEILQTESKRIQELIDRVDRLNQKEPRT